MLKTRVFLFTSRSNELYTRRIGVLRTSDSLSSKQTQEKKQKQSYAIDHPCKRKVVKNHVFSTYLINNVEYITILYENLLFFL